MFEDFDLGVASVKSSWRSRTKVADKCVETKPRKRFSRKTQTKSLVSTSTQTEPRKADGPVPSKIDESNKALVDFVIRAGPLMLRELNAATESRAFDDYKVVWEEERDQIHKLQTLMDGKKAGGTQEHALSCSDVAWNCTGSLIAAAYGNRDHVGWCEHQSAVACWSIMSRRLNTHEPDFRIQVPCCLETIAFHPSKPTILAGGLFTGEIRVWDVSNTDEPLIAQSTIDDHTHREPITQVCWVADVRGEYQLATTSGDGRILFWKMAHKLKYPISGAVILPNAQYHGQGDLRGNAYPIMGATALGFSNLDFVNYVVGTEGGGVLKCERRVVSSTQKRFKENNMIWNDEVNQLLRTISSKARYEVKKVLQRYQTKTGVKLIGLPELYAARPSPSIMFPSASKQSFERHSGPVYGIAPSPFHRNLFLTCSTDGSLRLYNMLRLPRPVILMEPSTSYLFDVAWSPARPLVFAVADAKGKIHIYDLAVETVTPVLSFQASGSSELRAPNGKSFSAVVSLEFSSRDPSLLAAADDQGEIILWQLSTRLSKIQDGELEMLEKLGAVDDDKKHSN
mmetsp:Transcript_21562/g.38245  ORF Transcript_21562/g.38245 Transcript_21562/m.38245 type:complete len:568 (+) Transcript_21562:84-1787(+)